MSTEAKPAGIRRRLMSVIVATSTLAVGAACVAFFTYDTVTFRRALIQQHTTLGRVIAANATAALAFDNQADAQEVLGAFKADPTVRFAALLDASGEVFVHYPRRAPVEAIPQTRVEGLAFERGQLVAWIPVVQDGQTRLGTLYFTASAAELFNRLRVYAIVSVIILGGGLAMAYVIGRRLQRQISEPILELAQVATAVSERQDYTLRGRTFGEGELGQLTTAFNAMLTRIEEQTRSLVASEANVRRLNEQLENRVRDRTAQLEAANQELESFSYSVSHDLRAPLRHVQGYVSMLQRAVDGQLPAKAQRYLKTINDASVEMGQLIDDLLEFSRMGRKEMRETVVSLDELARDAVTRLEMATQGRNIVWEIAPLPTVRGDPALLRQVWSNLLSNAVKYTRQRDPARIEIGTTGEEDGRLICFVRDNGAGFDMQCVHKLFGVFQRLHRAEEFEGTGIGLATVRRVIARHGGRVWAEATPGQGAAFYFTLAPVSVASATALP
jgi:signal transduction histidine kinase